jgi:hypothetical protein
MSQNMSHDDFSQRLQELSERIAAAKAAQNAGSKLDKDLSQRHMQEAERRHAALKTEFEKTDKHGWEQFKVSLSQSLEDLLDEFGHLFTDADEKTRHRK